MSAPDAERRDSDARAAARAIFDRPLVLEAGAGTGKTAALVGRLVVWCTGPGWERAAAVLGDAAGEPARVAARVLERVVAITFTEAAAAEMAERFARLLFELGRGEQPSALTGADAIDPQRARALGLCVDRLEVSTIHSYCARLLRRFPLEAGVHPEFRVDAHELAVARAVRETIEARLRDVYAEPGDPDLLALAEDGFGPAEVEDALVTALRGGLTAEALARDPFARERVEEFVARGAERCASWQELEAGRLAEVSARAKTTLSAAEALRACAGYVRAFPGGGVDALGELVAALRDELHDGTWRRLGEWSRGKLNKSERSALGDGADAFCAASLALREWLDDAAALQPEKLERARRALAPLLDGVSRTLRARGVQTFDTLLRDATALVRSNASVRRRVQVGLDQLLVDEFQDTDATQCELIRALALSGEPEARPGLFLVGDPKQSIYGWRRADLAAYERFVADVIAAGGVRHSLTRNFRSVPELLGEVNRFLEPVMQASAGLQPAYEPLVATREPAGEASVECWVTWLPHAEDGRPIVPRAADAAELEAGAIASDLARVHAEGVPWRDLALLLRARGDLDVYLEALRARDIPFAVEGDRSYYRRREVIELSALVRAVVDPNDHVSLVAWLRSASVGVPDAALIPLWTRGFPERLCALTRPDAKLLDPVRELVREAAGALPRDVPGLGRVRGWENALLAAVETLSALRASFVRDAPDRFVEELRVRTLVEATEASRYLGAHRLANLDRFFRRLTDDLCAGAGDVATVLRALRRRVREADREEEARPRDAGDDAVQVRTIHQAKGLDFEHVYLAQAHKESGGDDAQRGAGPGAGSRSTGAANEDAYQLFGAPTLAHGAAARAARRVESAEQVRTLYVALTRARQRVVVCGSWPLGPAPEPARSHAHLLARRDDAPDLPALFAAGEDAVAGGVRWRFPGLAEPAERSPAAPAATRPFARDRVLSDATALASRRASARRRMERPFRSRPSDEAETADTADDERTRGAGAARTVGAAIGSALHGALERFDPERPAVDENARLSSWLDRELARHVAPGDLPEAQRRARELWERFANGALGARRRALGRAVCCELPLLAPPGGSDPAVGYQSGSIDLCYRDPESGAWTVADYKTDRVASEADVARLVQRYAPQGRAYVEAVRSALGLEEPPRFELWLLDAGRVVAVPQVHSPVP